MKEKKTKKSGLSERAEKMWETRKPNISFHRNLCTLYIENNSREEALVQYFQFPIIYNVLCEKMDSSKAKIIAPGGFLCVDNVAEKEELHVGYHNGKQFILESKKLEGGLNSFEILSNQNRETPALKEAQK